MTTLVIITGASKGIGRSTAIAFAKDQRIQHLGLCLIARNQEGLMQTQALARNGASPGKMIPCSTHSIDLSNLDTLEMKIKGVFQEKMRSSDQYERVILINNAGSLGFLGPSSDLPPPSELKECIDFNITSSVWLSSYFVKFFGHEHNMKCNVVNMSSLCGIKPFKTMAMYCSGKAARDMWHKTLAMEESGGMVRVLNYAPGAIETDMTDHLSKSVTLDKELSSFYKKSKKESTYIQKGDTTKKLVNIIMEDTYTSGDHIDYWDYKEKYIFP